MKSKSKLYNIKINYDLIAVFAGLLLTLYFLLTARLSVGLPDEATYLTIPLRLLKGDRLFIDEWNLPQLASLFSLLPLKAYIALTGGTDGCILFMRYMFITVNAGFYAFMYYKLRRYKLAAVCAALLFCGIIPQTNFSLTYFTVAPMAVMAVCLVLFIGEPVKNRGVLFLMGVVFALGVLAEPFLLALYVIYGMGFLVYKILFKKQRENSVYAYLFDNRTFFCMTLGAFIMFLLFMGYLLYAGILVQLPSMLPYLFSGAEYNASNLTSTVKIQDVLYVYGKLHFAGIALCIAASLICRFYYKNPFRMRLIIFIFSMLLLSSCYLYCGYRILHGSYDTGSVYHEVPMLFFPLIWYLLCSEKNDRLFIIWLIGFAASLFIDYSSDVMLGSCGRVTQTVGFISLATLLKELK
ncbi:MAG: hypothetical protein IJL25_05270, partial [Clostridia bacterium]|nr:hypothetical protein [Clostridia bacterium]